MSSKDIIKTKRQLERPSTKMDGYIRVILVNGLKMER
uniref:Uncharacterized protein n=1 Tax=Parascaris equorum TaxID=6256 RepID=A0A914RWL2_PAREQ